MIHMADIISKRERIIWVLSIVILMTIFIVAVIKYEKTLNLLNERVTQLEAEKTDWLQREANLNLQIEDLIKQSEEYARIINNFPSNSFEDGHIYGYMLLNYSIDNNKNIIWKVIDSYLFGE